MAGPNDKEDPLTPQDVRRWLRQEMLDLTKGFQLRVLEATGIASAYSAGEMSPEQVAQRLFEYDERWGDALPGTSVSKDMTDEEILARIDKARGHASPGFEGRFGKKGSGPNETSR